MMQLRKMPKSQERGPGAPGSRFLPLGLIAGPAGGIVTTLLKNWKAVLFAVLIGIIAYQNTMKLEILSLVGLRTIPGVIQDYDKQVTDLKKELHDTQLQSLEYELANEKLKGAVGALNSQVEKWSALTGKLQEQNTALGQRLSELKHKSDEQVQAILNGPKPKTCEGAIQLLRDAAQGGAKWEKP